MQWSTLSRVAFLAVAAALGCSGDARPSGLTGDPIDASFDLDDVLLTRGGGGGGGVILGGGAPPVATPSRDAAASLACRTSAILVVDRSGSMRENTLDGAPKWNALLAALAAVLPRIEHNVALGLVMFPQPGAACGLRTTLDLEPQLNAAGAILARLRASTPDGPTPTAGAVEVAGRWFVDHPAVDGERYLLLATDGAPNCNPALDLDVARTVETIDRFRRQEVFTYVVGLNGAGAFASVLDAMADAGGRARATTPRFYPANTVADLASEFSTITWGIANNCP